MRLNHLQYLCCPQCQGELSLSTHQKKENDKIVEGQISCQSCHKEYPIIKSIPRFVPFDNYATGFGFQWNLHAKTQLDSANGSHVSEERYKKETRWPDRLEGEIILEAGSGSGRFTEHVVKSKAMIISFDYSHAVEANYAQNGHNENLLLIQADIYNMPFKRKSFDRVLCIGVLQHTPDPKKSFFSLCEMIKPSGYLCVDIYRKTFRTATKYLARTFTKNLPNQKLYSAVDRYIELMWPISTVNTILFRKVGHIINRLLLVPDYRPMLNLPEKSMYKTWAKLDLFDALAPAYDYPQTIDEFKSWFQEAKLHNIDVHKGYNGIEGRATN